MSRGKYLLIPDSDDILSLDIIKLKKTNINNINNINKYFII